MKALLLIDIQNDYFKGGRFPLAGMKKAAGKAANLLDTFRKENNPVIHIRHISLNEKGGRPDSSRKPRFFLPGTPGSEINPLVMPLETEKIIIKHYPNSFRGTGLDETLKKLDVTELHIAGAMTNMCVDSTVRAGFDLGYTIVLHPEACAARGILGTKLVHIISVKTLTGVFATA